jgi:hypothetical protein
MSNHNIWLLLVISAIGLALTAYELISALRTGKAFGRWGSTITRSGRPRVFRNWIIGQIIVVAFFFGVLIWIVLGNT